MTGADLRELLAIPRPRTRAECRDAVRPCPWVGCKHHLLLEVIAASSSRRHANALAFTDRAGVRIVLPGPADVEQLESFGDAAIERLVELDESCALDVADRGGLDASHLAELAGMTPGNVRRAVRKYRARLIARLGRARKEADRAA